MRIRSNAQLVLLGLAIFFLVWAVVGFWVAVSSLTTYYFGVLIGIQRR